MKCQVLITLKKNIQKSIRILSAAVVILDLRVNCRAGRVIRTTGVGGGSFMLYIISRVNEYFRKPQQQRRPWSHIGMHSVTWAYLSDITHKGPFLEWYFNYRFIDTLIVQTLNRSIRAMWFIHAMDANAK